MLIGKDKSLNEQIKILKTILYKSKEIKEVLEILEDYSKTNPNFKDYYLAAGCINQTVLNYYHNYPLNYGINDFDIVYFDNDTSYESEDLIIKELSSKLKHININFDIKNENRVPIWYNQKYHIKRDNYLSLEDAISKWTSTITCIGVRKNNNKLIVYAPYGLNDLFSLIVRPVKLEVYEKLYNEKVKKWTTLWPKLKFIKW